MRDWWRARMRVVLALHIYSVLVGISLLLVIGCLRLVFAGMRWLVSFLR